jgi:hypothetical protein
MEGPNLLTTTRSEGGVLLRPVGVKDVYLEDWKGGAVTHAAKLAIVRVVRDLECLRNACKGAKTQSAQCPS